MIIKKPKRGNKLETVTYSTPKSQVIVEPLNKTIQKNPSVEIGCFAFRYPRRTWWQLSSIAGQVASKGIQVPDIKFTLNLHKTDPGHDMWDKLIDTFSPLVDLNVRWWNTDDFFRRAATRTKDIKEATGDFLLFVDADQVWHPEFFSTLAPFMKKYDEENEGRCVAHWRYTMSIDDGNKIVDSEQYNDVPINNWFGKIKSVPHKIISGARGAGGFQLVNTRLLRERGIDTYGNPNKDSPANAKVHYKTKTEMHFRARIGGVYRKHCNLFKPFYHINHFRADDRLVKMDQNYLF